MLSLPSASSSAKPVVDKELLVTQKDIVALASSCLKRWEQSKLKELRGLHKACGDLSGTILRRSRREQPVGQRTSLGATQTLLEDAASLEQATAAALEQASKSFHTLRGGSDRCTQISNDIVEREVCHWLQRTVDKACCLMVINDFNMKGTLDNCSSDERDAASEEKDAEHLLRKQLGAQLQEEVKPQVRALYERQFRPCFRQSTSCLTQAVDESMRGGAASMADDRARQAAVRLNSTTSRLEELLPGLAADMATVVHETLRPLAAPDAPIQQASKALSFEAVLHSKAYLRKLENSLDRLSDEVSQTRKTLQRCSVPGVVEQPEGDTPQTGVRREVAVLLAKGNFEEAFCQACQHDAAHPDEASLAEWACEQALAASAAKDLDSPDSFLAQEPRPLRSPKVQLDLMSRLLARTQAADVQLETVEQNLDWVVSLATMLELVPAVHADFEAALPVLQELLQDLLLTKAPASLIAAPSTARLRVRRSAHLATKQLEVLRKVAQSMFQ